MADDDGSCAHLDDTVDPAPTPRTAEGCEECLASGGTWFHLRLCLACGHVGCCDQSAGQHTTAHHRETGHPLIRSYEPGEDWFYCYVDDAGFILDDMPPAPSHP